MALLHIIFHFCQVLLGSYSLYALLMNTLQIAVILLFVTVAMELLDRQIRRLDKIVQAKIGF